MAWRAEQTPTSWLVREGDRARGEEWAYVTPDRHGRVARLYSSRGHDATLQAVQAACAAAREAMPPRCCGGLFYGTKISLLRGEFCQRVAGILNGEGA